MNVPSCRFEVTHTRPIEFSRESGPAVATSCATALTATSRILFQVLIFEHDVDHRIAIRALEPIAVVIKRQPKLPDAGNALERPRCADRTESPGR